MLFSRAVGRPGRLGHMHASAPVRPDGETLIK